MPQLDISTFAPQLVWLVITFGVLYLLMSRRWLPRIGEVIEERQDRIDGDLELAEELKKESEELEESYQKHLANARTEAAAFLKAERAKSDAALAAKRKEMGARIAERISEAEGRIAKAKKKALGEVDGVSAEACAAIVAKLTGKALPAAAARSAVKKELGGGKR